MANEDGSNGSFLIPKIASISIVIIFAISLVGGFIVNSNANNTSGTSCTFEQIMQLVPECLEYFWTVRGRTGRWKLFFSLLDALSVALMIPIFQGFKRLIKDNKSADFMLGCVKLATIFSIFNTIFNGSATEYASFLTTRMVQEYYPYLEIAFQMTTNLFSWISSIDELLYTIVFLYLAALGSSTKIFPKGFNVTNLVLAISSFLAFIFGILYLLWNSLIVVEFIVRLIYFICLVVWIFWAFYFFRTMA